MHDFEKTKGTVHYLNNFINVYFNKIEWWKTIYSLDGWAEVYTTDAFGSEVSDYAPILSDKLTMLKEYIDRGNNVFEADIDSLIKKFGLNFHESKLHLKLEPYLDKHD